jgi:phosphate transport system ATP-binding protein
MTEGYQAVPTASPVSLEARGLSVWAGTRWLLRNVNLAVPPRQVFGLMGPSGAGKSTLLRCLNRLIDLTPELRVSGEVLFHGRSIRAPGVDVDALRACIGMLFQQPVVFPKSILQNVVFGTRHLRRVPRRHWPEVAERALRESALWDEVKDRLHEPALRLSVGQQQRLCLARTLAVDPQVILMDEPTSALDPRSTEAIETLILKLRETRTIVLVTHNLGQAQRVADYLACVAVRGGAGEIIEVCRCNEFMQGLAGEELVDLAESPGRAANR